MDMIARVGLVLVLFSAALVAGAPIGNTPNSAVKELVQLEQEEISCMLRDNRTKRAEFYTAVRTNHGFPETSVRSFRPKVLRTDSVRCFSERHCPESEITWCLNLHHSTKSIEVCWDSSSNILNCTADAQQLGLDSYLNVVQGCLFSRGDSCMSLQDTPFFLDGGLLTCTAESTSCVHKSFISITVEYVGLTADPPKIEFHNTSDELVLGERNIYLVSTVYPTDPIDFFFGFGEGLNAFSDDMPASPIPQNGPFCEVTEGCQPAGPQYDAARNERIRFYSYSTTSCDCPATSRTYYSWLVIDDAKESDANTEYRFSASSFVYNPFPHPFPVSSNFMLHLTASVSSEGSGTVEDLVGGMFSEQTF